MPATTVRAPEVPTRLDEVLAYRHEGVVRRYCKEHSTPRAEGEEVFRETLKWLYLCHVSAYGPEDFACSMFPEIEKVDWMWHTFILFTRDYAEFCQRYFGFFLHHVPAEDGLDTGPADEEAVRAELERQLGFVYDVLGEETLRAWFDERRYAQAG
jgi:hypothetical protein